jgi:hypothetical protein
MVEGGPHWGAPAIVAAIVVGAVRAVVLTFPLPLALTLTFAAIVGLGQEGEGPPGDMTVPAVVGAEAAAAAEGVLHLRAQGRAWMSVPEPPCGPTRSAQV